MYTAKNKYGISGETRHKTVKAALKARDRREGDGWMVIDDDDNVYDGSKMDGYDDITRIDR